MLEALSELFRMPLAHFARNFEQLTLGQIVVLLVVLLALMRVSMGITEK